MFTNQNYIVVPPLPFTPFFFIHNLDLFILSNETAIPDLSIFIPLKGFASQVPNDIKLKRYGSFQEQWKNSHEYKMFPYDFENILQVTLSRSKTDWPINRDFFDKEHDYYIRVKYLGQGPDSTEKVLSARTS